MSGASIMLLALVIDAGLGWPPTIHAKIGHPVTWMGALIAVLDRRFNRESDSETTRRMAGVCAAIIIIALVAGIGWGCALMLPSGWPGLILAAILAWPLVAARSMHDHVDAVVRPLMSGDLPEARQGGATSFWRGPPHTAWGRGAQCLPDAPRRNWMRPGSRAPRPRASPKIPPTESWRRCSGARSSACRA